MKNKNFYKIKLLAIGISITLILIPIAMSQSIKTKDRGYDYENQEINDNEYYDLDYINNLLYDSNELKKVLYEQKVGFSDLAIDYIDILKIDNNDDQVIVSIPIKNRIQSIIILIFNDNIIEIGTFNLVYRYNKLVSELTLIFSDNHYKVLILNFGTYPIINTKIDLNNNEKSFLNKAITDLNDLCKILGLMILSSACSICAYLTSLEQPANIICFFCGLTTHVWKICDLFFPPTY